MKLTIFIISIGVLAFIGIKKFIQLCKWVKLSPKEKKERKEWKEHRKYIREYQRRNPSMENRGPFPIACFVENEMIEKLGGHIRIDFYPKNHLRPRGHHKKTGERETPLF